ncbi:Hypothetical protein A7982_05501 [Minicystis rosea]|nr:Hypothetical protein A7982_05501 [Minicystis rosea]
MNVTLTNKTAQMATFLLPHESYCAARGECACFVLPGWPAQRVPSSLTVPAKGAIVGLEHAVLAVLEIARAVRTGDVQATHAQPVSRKR